jgi:hypothetical protein
MKKKVVVKRKSPKKRRATRVGKTNRVPKTRASGTWTEAAFFAFLRSGLRNMSRRWRPLVCDALNRVRRKSISKKNPRLKWQYQCEKCGGWFSRKNVEVNHKDPCGSMNCMEDLPGYVSRLFCEVEDLEVLCKKKCHAEHTRSIRKKPVTAKIKCKGLL